MCSGKLSLAQVTSIERGTITQKDLDEALGESHAIPEVLCAPSSDPPRRTPSLMHSLHASQSADQAPCSRQSMATTECLILRFSPECMWRPCILQVSPERKDRFSALRSGRFFSRWPLAAARLPSLGYA